MSERLLTLGEAAERLACSVATVKRRICCGELPAFRDGRILRVCERDLDRYVSERTTLPAAPPAPERSRLAGAWLTDGRSLFDLPDPLP